MDGGRRALLEATVEVEREESRIHAQCEQYATERLAFAREKAALAEENAHLKARIIILEEDLHAAKAVFAQQLKRREQQAERECGELHREIERTARYAAQRALPRVRGQPDLAADNGGCAAADGGPSGGDAAPRTGLTATSLLSPLPHGEARSPSGRRFSLYNTYARLLEREEGLSPTTLFIA